MFVYKTGGNFHFFFCEHWKKVFKALGPVAVIHSEGRAAVSIMDTIGGGSSSQVWQGGRRKCKGFLAEVGIKISLPKIKIKNKIRL